MRVVCLISILSKRPHPLDDPYDAKRLTTETFDFPEFKPRRRLDIDAQRTPARRRVCFQMCCEHFPVDSPSRINTKKETEDVMAVAFNRALQPLAASGELDGYLDSTRLEDKVTGAGVILPNDPNLLLHNLGIGVDQERIKNLIQSLWHSHNYEEHSYNGRK